MRKYFVYLILAFFIFVNCFTFAFADKSEIIPIYLNNSLLTFDDPPRIVNKRVMVPLRALLTALNASIEWQAETRTAIAKTAEHQLAMTLDKNSAIVDNQAVTLDAPPLLINNRIFIPLRFVSESFGLNVKWDNATRSVKIASENKKSATEKPAMGKSVDVLTQYYGQPQQILLSMYGFDWYVYHNNYHDFKMFGIKDARIVAIYNKTTETFGEFNLKYGDSKSDICKLYQCPIETIRKGRTIYNVAEKNSDLFENDTYYVRAFYDHFNDDKVTATLIIESTIEQNTEGFYGKDNPAVKLAYEEILFALCNADRRYYNLPLFEKHDKAQVVARNHSNDMIKRNFFEHINPDGIAPHERLENYHLAFSYSGENIACGEYSALYAHHDLMNSAHHRENILGPAKHLSVGVGFGGEHHRYYTEVFYTPFK